MNDLLSPAYMAYFLFMLEFSWLRQIPRDSCRSTLRFHRIRLFISDFVDFIFIEPLMRIESLNTIISK